MLAELIGTAFTYDRYAELPPVVVSTDLSVSWVLQLGHKPNEVRHRQQRQQCGQLQVKPQIAQPSCCG